VTEGAAYGGALLAGVGAGVYPTVEDACQGVVRTTRRVEPIPDHVARYAESYAIYRSLYPALKPVFDRLSAIQ
jgi:xylulokinase